MKNNYKIKDLQKSYPSVSTSDKPFPNEGSESKGLEIEAVNGRDKVEARKKGATYLNEKLFRYAPSKTLPTKEAILKTPLKTKDVYKSKLEEALESEKQTETPASMESDTSSSSSSSSGSVAVTTKIEGMKNEKSNDNVASIDSDTSSSSSDSESDSNSETETEFDPKGSVAIQSPASTHPANTQAMPRTRAIQSIAEDTFGVHVQTADNVPEWFPATIKAILRDPRCPTDLGYVQLNALTSFRLRLESTRRQKWKRYICAGKACSQLETAIRNLQKRAGQTRAVARWLDGVLWDLIDIGVFRGFADLFLNPICLTYTLSSPTNHRPPRTPDYGTNKEMRTSHQVCKSRNGSSVWQKLGRIAASWIGWAHQDSSKHWKPVTLQAPVLGGFIIFSLSIIIILEILSHIAFGNGGINGSGLAFGVDVNHLPLSATIGYLYLPTVLAVIYSILWAWVDLDTKRLEPWLQLSNEGGASAEDSLLLNYPFEFIPFIPVTAFRRKHWAVFFASTIMLMIFWVITPLQSAIFNTGTVTRSIPTIMGTSASLIPLEMQYSKLNANFLDTAYGIAWLNQSLPPFTTSKSVVLPFKPLPGTGRASSTESWSATSQVFSTTLNCTPAIVTQGNLGFTIDSGRGCILPEFSFNWMANGEYMLAYIGYYNNPQVDYNLASPNCSIEHANNFLAIFTTQESPNNLTALFCVPAYHIQEIPVRANASDGAITVLYNQASGNKVTDLSEEIFNKTGFEYIMGAGVVEDRFAQRFNYSNNQVVEQAPRVQLYNVSTPITNMVGFAVALTIATTPLNDLSDPINLKDAFERAHQLLFSTALSVLTGSLSSEGLQDIRAGIRQDTLGAITINSPIARVVEGALGVIIILTTFLWYFSHKRRSSLSRCPASIADIWSTACHGRTPLDDFKDHGSLSEVILEEKLLTKRFRLTSTENGHQYIEVTSERQIPSHIPLKKITASKHPEPPVRPTELRLLFGIPFLLLITICLAGIIFLQIWTSRYNGISLPSDNTIIRSILENYLPTLFATLLEPDHFLVAMSNISSGTELPAWTDRDFFYTPFDLVAPESKETFLEYGGSTTGFGADLNCVELTATPSDDMVQFQVNQTGSSFTFTTSHRLPNDTVVDCLFRDQLDKNPLTNINKITDGSSALEIMRSMAPVGGDDGGFCNSTIVAGWVRVSSNATSTGHNINSTFLSCTPSLRVANFDIIVNPTGHLISSNRTSDYAQDLGPYLGSAANLELLRQASTFMTPLTDVTAFAWHNDSLLSDWMNSLLAFQMNTTRLVDPSTPAPNVEDVAPPLEAMYRLLFSVLLSLNQDAFLTTPSRPASVSATMSETRIFVSPVTFNISVILFSSHLLVGILYYITRPKRFLPRMPTTIASILAYVSASRPIFNADRLRRQGPRYSYGRFLGVDGGVYAGIERGEFMLS
ncbi:hypothetical protein B7494_g3002 [Chlorociboria aeruginascens]|nr:hypothetical protein B7494_g3002 [Chlorociboria aeruginascens]